MAANFALFALIVTALQTSSWQFSLPSDPTYYAGVVEFSPALDGSGQSRAEDNLDRMLKIIESEATRDLDILVFPEYALNNVDWKTYVPDPELGIAPCEIADYELFLRQISCAARSRRLYVLVNVVEKTLCSSQPKETCDARKINSYNTNVVFDREGRVVSTYRKTHLYSSEWYARNVMAKPELVTFSTDFGVTFGHFTCFDMLFYEPAEVLIHELNVTDIIYPTYWFSELPFLTAVQLQEGWAYANNVNLLAAGASNPAGKNTGSGIYAGRLGRLTAVIYDEPTTKLLTARVPKHSVQGPRTHPPTVPPAFVPQLETPRFTRLNLLRDYNVDIFATKLLPSDFTRVISEPLCHGDFCCRFDVQRVLVADSVSHEAYRYRLAAYSGDRATHQSMDPADLSVCAVIACTNSDLYSCGHIFPDGIRVANKFYFNAISVSGSFRNARPHRLIMPSTVDAEMMPLPVGMWAMSEVAGANSTEVSIVLTSPKADLLTFGIWANYYHKGSVTHNLDPQMQTARSWASDGSSTCNSSNPSPF